VAVPKAKWLEAPNALNLAQLNAQAKAMAPNSEVSDNSCKALLHDVGSMVKGADLQNLNLSVRHRSLHQGWYVVRRGTALRKRTAPDFVTVM